MHFSSNKDGVRDTGSDNRGGLIEQLEKLYKKQYGPVRESEQQLVNEDTRPQMLDDEINELRETLKYAAIAGERLDGKE